MIFVRALIFGVTLAIAIGPIALLIIRYAITEGIWAGLASAWGAALGDLTYAIVALTVGTVLAPFLTTHATQAHAVAAIALMLFGVWLLWTARHPASTMESSPITRSRHRITPLVTTYALTVTNPLTTIAFLAFIGQLPADTTRSTRVVAAVGLFIGSLCIQIVLALGGTVLSRVLTSPRHMQLLHVLSGIGILLFGVVGLLDVSPA